MQTFHFVRVIENGYADGGYLFADKTLGSAHLPSHILFVPRANSLGYQMYESNSLGAQLVPITINTHNVMRFVLCTDFFITLEADALLDYLDMMGYEEPYLPAGGLQGSISNANVGTDNVGTDNVGTDNVGADNVGADSFNPIQTSLEYDQ